MSRVTENGTKTSNVCPRCSSEVGPLSRYCDKCGYGLEVNGTSEDLSVIDSLRKENQVLRLRLMKVGRRPSRLTGFALFAFGLVAFASSIFSESNILAFIGLGLTLWGALLLYVRPTQYTKSQILESTTRTHYASLKKLLDHLGYEGQPVYLPPRRLEDLKGGNVFIAAEEGEESINAIMSEDFTPEFVTVKPPGVCVVAPGLGLVNLLEEEMGRDFPGMDVSYLESNLPTALTEDVEIAESVEMEVRGEETTVRIRNSVFEYLYRDVLDARLERLGCPLVSSIALALTRATGQPITIQAIKTELEINTLTIHYKMLGGMEK